MRSGVYKGHSDVAHPPSGGQAFVVVREAARVHQGPAFTSGLDGAVVAEEPAASTLQHNTHISLCSSHTHTPREY